MQNSHAAHSHSDTEWELFWDFSFFFFCEPVGVLEMRHLFQELSVLINGRVSVD